MVSAGSSRLQDSLAEAIIEGTIEEGQTVVVSVDDGNFVIGSGEAPKSSSEIEAGESATTDEPVSEDEDEPSLSSDPTEKTD